MDKYTKTINELKKEYRNLKLSNTHNKSTNNKLMNGGAIAQDDQQKDKDIIQQSPIVQENSTTIIQGNRANKNQIISLSSNPASKAKVDYITSLLSNDKVKLDDIPDYTEHFYYNDDNFVFPHADYSVMNCMLFYKSNFI
tara:strand:+ start:62 stop:481 length:420 start_codon:yes stop_codon:yes gene_type:complete